LSENSCASNLKFVKIHEFDKILKFVKIHEFDKILKFAKKKFLHVVVSAY